MDICKSLERFPSKPTREEFSRIRFEKVSVAPWDLVRLLEEGYAFHFPSEDGFRKKESITGTQVIFVDVDDLPLDGSLDEYVNGLRYRPNIYYTTANDNPDGLRRFRMVWLLDRFIEAFEFENVYSGLVRLNRLPLKSEVGYGVDVGVINQFYFGCTDGHTVTIAKYPYFHVNEIKEVDTVFHCHQHRVETEPVVIDPYFVKEYLNTPVANFLHKYPQYRKLFIEKVQEGDMALDSSGAFYRPNTADGIYFLLPRKWEDGRCIYRADGQSRRKNLYLATQIMRYNYPRITPEELLYCVAFETFHHYTLGAELTKYEVVSIVERAYEYEFDYSGLMKKRTFNGKTLPKRYRRFKLNKEYWTERGIDLRTAVNTVARYLNETDNDTPPMTNNHNSNNESITNIDIHYNPFCQIHTNSDNHYYYKELSRQHFTGLSQAERRTMELLLEGKKQGEIAKELGIDRRSVCRYIKKLDGVYIKGDGNTSNKTWGRIEREENQKERWEDGTTSTEKEEVYVVGGTPYNREYSDGTTDEYWRMMRRYERQQEEDWDDEEEDELEPVV